MTFPRGDRVRPHVLSRSLDRRTLLRFGLAGAAVALREHLAARRARGEIGRAMPPPDSA